MAKKFTTVDVLTACEKCDGINNNLGGGMETVYLLQEAAEGLVRYLNSTKPDYMFDRRRKTNSRPASKEAGEKNKYRWALEYSGRHGCVMEITHYVPVGEEISLTKNKVVFPLECLFPKIGER